MAKPRSRRRDFAEQPPEILSLQLRLLQYLKDYWKWLVLALVVVFIAIGAWGIRAQIQARRAEKAGAAMAKITPLLSKPETAAAAIHSLEGVIKDYPGTPSALEASMFRAHLLYQTGKYAAAAKAYAALAQIPDPSWDLLVADSLSYCYEALGDFRQAAQSLEPLAEQAPAPLQSQIYQRLAMLLDKSGKPKEAAHYWRKLVDRPPNPVLLPYFKEKLAATEAASGKK